MIGMGIGLQSLGGMLGDFQQAQYTAQMGLQNMLNNAGAFAQMSDARFSQLYGNALANAAPSTTADRFFSDTFSEGGTKISPKVNGWYHKQQAEHHADRGEKLIGRIAFWLEIPLVGARIAGRLADNLDFVTSLVESELALA
jgi:hypothetical protein